MKYLLFFHVCVMVIITYGCHLNRGNDRVRDFIPGTYIRFSQHEYGTEYDTLVISLQNIEAREYKIIRKWKYDRVLDGRPVEPEYKKTISSGIYQPDHKLLRETETGDFYSFDVRENTLFNGPLKYQKL